MYSLEYKYTLGELNMSISNKFNQLNPVLFENYFKNIDILENKFFFYSEIIPKPNMTITFGGHIFSLKKPITVEIVGTISNPKRSLKKILSACYQKEEFLSQNDNGCLFIYNGFTPYEEELKISDSPLKLKFLVYKLKIIN